MTIQKKDLQSEIFAMKNIKKTKQRVLVYSILSNNEFPVTAETLYFESGAEDSTISLSTVYRTLDLFVERGIVSKTILNNSDKAIYEICGEIHKHHLICVSCKSIMAVEGCPIEKYEQKLAHDTNYTIIEHKLDLYGYCPKCQR